MTYPSDVCVDLDQREAAIRRRVYDESNFWLEPPEDPESLIATYFLRVRGGSLMAAGKAISYHMTTGTKHPVPGTLTDRCTGRVEGVRAWDESGRGGLIRVAFPTDLFRHVDGKFYTTDIFHLMAGEGVCGLWEFEEAKLVDVKFPAAVLSTFPGPAYGCDGVRKLTDWPDDQPAFGTILKPTAGITDDEVAHLVDGVAGETLFMFVKEDENLFPHLPYCPVISRAQKSIRSHSPPARVAGWSGTDLCPAYHVASPLVRSKRLSSVLETGVNGLMFSEQFTGGSVRSVARN